MGAWGAAWVGLGGVSPGAMVAVHAALAVGGIAAAAMDRGHLERAGAAWSWAAATVLVIGAAALALVPLPSWILSVTGPGRIAAWPDLAVGPSTADVGLTLDAIGRSLAVGSFAVLATVAAVRGISRRLAERWVVGGVAILVSTALAHGLTGLDDAFGVVPVAADGVLFLPIVNPNHLAALCTLVLPTLIGRTVDASDPTERALTGLTLGTTAMLVLLLQSTAGLVFGGAVAGIASIRLGLPRRWWAAGAVLVVPVAAWATFGPRAVGPHVIGRLIHWGDAARMGVDHWLLGTGAGTYAVTIDAYRSDAAFVSWTHAHSEPLQWAVETGIVGCGALLVAAMLLRPRAAPTQRDTSWRIDLGLAGLGAHALVDFPLHLPAIAMGAAGLWAVRLALHGPARPSGAGALRVLLVCLAIAQIPAAGLATWRARATPGSEAHDALVASGDVDAFLAAEAADGEALLRGAHHLARRLRDDDALRVLERASVRAPADRRIAILQARLHDRGLRPAAAAEAWARAFRLDAPPSDVPAAVRAFPLGSWWLDALDDARPAHLVALARAVVDREPAVAVTALERAAARAPDAYATLPDLPRALDAAGRRADALAWTAEALQEDPDAAALWWERARLLREDDPDAAVDAARTAALGDRAFASRAVRLTGELRDPEAGLTLVRDLELHGRVPPHAVLEAARLHLRLGRSGTCRATLERIDGAGDDALAAAIAALRERCGR